MVGTFDPHYIATARQYADEVVSAVGFRAAVRPDPERLFGFDERLFA